MGGNAEGEGGRRRDNGGGGAVEVGRGETGGGEGGWGGTGAGMYFISYFIGFVTKSWIL